ncbi:MAG: GLUG motif-containing protein, partial [Planctomycetota bacterium]
CGLVWTINDGVDYPRLLWENAPGELLDADLSDFVAGAGTESDPYLIYTAEELNLIGLFWCEFDKHFKLMADIDLSAYTGTAFNIVGNQVIEFSGVFDGDGHTISNFTYSTLRREYVALFGYVGSGGEIKNLGMVNVNVYADKGYVVGRLVGRNDGTVSNCYATGSVFGYNEIGGLVGRNEGTVSDCYATGSVFGYNEIGGLVGWNDGMVSDCNASGSVTQLGDWGNYHVGGLVGWNVDGTVSNCSAAGIVTGVYSVGGLVGSNEAGTVSKCYATGSVSGKVHVGGLIGGVYATVSDCYAAASVTGVGSSNWEIGGLVGVSGGTVSNCYAIGSVSGNYQVGGLMGNYYDGTVTASFWDIDTSGQATSAAGTGKTTGEMQTRSTFTDAGWDFVGETANGTEDIWELQGPNYPCLAWQMDSSQDSDDDEIPDNEDNCPDDYNPGQSDVDEDGVGDLCDMCPADANDECDPNGSVAEEIDPNEGSIIETPDGDLIIHIEPNALSEPTTISITKILPEDPNVDLMISSNQGEGVAVAVYDLQPDGMVFDEPVTVTFTSDLSQYNCEQR